MQRQMAVLTMNLKSEVEILKKRAWHRFLYSAAQRFAFFFIQRKTVLLASCTNTKMLVFLLHSSLLRDLRAAV